MSLSLQPLIHRSQGLPHAHRDVTQAANRLINTSVIKDIFSAQVLALPKNSSHTIVHKGNYVAIISRGKTDVQVQTISLYSLSHKSMLWSTETQLQPKAMPITCKLSDCGMLVLEGAYGSPKRILLNGKETGSFTSTLLQTFCVGTTVLGYGKEKNNEGRSINFFEARDYQGKSQIRHQLDDSTKIGFAHNERFVVRLPTTSHNSPGSVQIEIIDLITGTMTTPTLTTSIHESRSLCPCIYNNLLIYGKYSSISSTSFRDATICIYDLLQMKIISEFDTGTAEHSWVSQITANTDYIAWVEPTCASRVISIKYRNMSTGKITTLKQSEPMAAGKVTFQMNHHILSVVYAKERAPNHPEPIWCREIVDMEKEMTHKTVHYKNFVDSECFLSKDSIMITDPQHDRIYIENFSNLGTTSSSDNARLYI